MMDLALVVEAGGCHLHPEHQDCIRQTMARPLRADVYFGDVRLRARQLQFVSILLKALGCTPL